MIWWTIILLNFVAELMVHEWLQSAAGALEHQVRVTITGTLLFCVVLYALVRSIGYNDHKYTHEFAIVVVYLVASFLATLADYLNFDKRLNTPLINVIILWTMLFVYALVSWPQFRQFVTGVKKIQETVVNKDEGLHPNHHVASDTNSDDAQA